MTHKNARRKIVPKAGTRRVRSRPRQRLARDHVLPGMEAVRHVTLDRLCTSVAECRLTANTCRQDEVGYKGTALTYMQGRSITVYTHGGIRFVRVPGHDELRVSTVRGDGDTEVRGHPIVSGNGQEPGVDDAMAE